MSEQVGKASAASKKSFCRLHQALDERILPVSQLSLEEFNHLELWHLGISGEQLYPLPPNAHMEPYLKEV